MRWAHAFENCNSSFVTLSCTNSCSHDAPHLHRDGAFMSGGMGPRNTLTGANLCLLWGESEDLLYIIDQNFTALSPHHIPSSFIWLAASQRTAASGTGTCPSGPRTTHTSDSLYTRARPRRPGG